MEDLGVYSHSEANLQLAMNSMFHVLGLDACPQPLWARRPLSLASATALFRRAAGWYSSRRRLVSHGEQHRTRGSISSQERLDLKQRIINDPALGPLVEWVNGLTGCRFDTEHCLQPAEWLRKSSTAGRVLRT